MNSPTSLSVDESLSCAGWHAQASASEYITCPGSAGSLRPPRPSAAFRAWNQRRNAARRRPQRRKKAKPPQGQALDSRHALIELPLRRASRASRPNRPEPLSATRPSSKITSRLDSEVAMLDILACGKLGRGPGPHHAALFQHIVYVRRAGQCAHVLVDQQDRQPLGLQPPDRAVDLRPY